jgi:hypothetical protein
VRELKSGRDELVSSAGRWGEIRGLIRARWARNREGTYHACRRVERICRPRPCSGQGRRSWTRALERPCRGEKAGKVEEERLGKEERNRWRGRWQGAAGGQGRAVVVGAMVVAVARAPRGREGDHSHTDRQAMGNNILFRMFGPVYAEPRQRIKVGNRSPCRELSAKMRFEPASCLSTTSYTPSHGPGRPGEGSLAQVSTAYTLFPPLHHAHWVMHRCHDRKRQSAASQSATR